VWPQEKAKCHFVSIEIIVPRLNTVSLQRSTLCNIKSEDVEYLLILEQRSSTIYNNHIAK